MTARGWSAPPWRALPWTIVIVVTAVVFWAGLPWLVQQFPTQRAVEPGERVPLQVASYVPPAGWIIDIPSAAATRPEVVDGNVRTRAQAGVWFGSSQALLERLAEQLRDAGATVEPLPQAPSAAPSFALDEPAEREDYDIHFTVDGEYGTIYVVREVVSVVVIRAVGPAVEMTDAARLLRAMVDSVDTGEVGIDDAPPNPRFLPDAGAGLRAEDAAAAPGRFGAQARPR